MFPTLIKPVNLLLPIPVCVYFGFIVSGSKGRSRVAMANALLTCSSGDLHPSRERQVRKALNFGLDPRATWVEAGRAACPLGFLTLASWCTKAFSPMKSAAQAKGMPAIEWPIMRSNVCMCVVVVGGGRGERMSLSQGQGESPSQGERGKWDPELPAKTCPA